MRSLKYILLNEPTNMHDCLDRFNNNVSRILASVQINDEDGMNEDITFFRKILSVNYVWYFNDMAVLYNKVYGSCFVHEDEERQKESVNNANRRFVIDIKKIKEKTGLMVYVHDKFDDSCLCKKEK